MNYAEESRQYQAMLEARRRLDYATAALVAFVYQRQAAADDVERARRSLVVAHDH